MIDKSNKTFSGKTIIVTGGTQGLGENIARHLAGLGTENIVICGRNQKRGKSVARDLTDAGTSTLYIKQTFL